MASDGGSVGRNPGRRAPKSNFHWVSSSPTPAEVAVLEARYPDVVQVPVAELEAEAADWQHRAVLLRTFHRWVPAEAFLREFRRAGIPGEILPLSLAYRCHIFRFADSSARDMVLNRPWLVNGQPVASETWRPEFFPAADSVTSALLWIRLPNLPFEFWREEILKEIVAPIGRFLFADAATLERNRGAFARVCARIDLRYPLRPGSRLQGMSGPFWQQYVYEGLEGICKHCGSLHLCGSCPSSVRPAAQASSEAPLFGSWMSAIRQRSVTQGSQADFRGKLSKESATESSVPRSKDPALLSEPGDLAEGWSVPPKLARRRGARGLKIPASLHEVSGLTEGKMMKKGVVNDSVPVPSVRAGSPKGVLSLGSAVSEFQQTETISSQSLQSKNPFAYLGVESSEASPSGSRDACPSPLKRARPTEYLAPRVITKKVIKKGKGCDSSSKLKQAKSDGLDHPIAALGLSVVNPDKGLVGEQVQSFRPTGSSSDSDILDQGIGPRVIDNAPRSEEA